MVERTIVSMGGRNTTVKTVVVQVFVNMEWLCDCAGSVAGQEYANTGHNTTSARNAADRACANTEDENTGAETAAQ